jgi:GT2 family glycosyltransferase
MEATVAKATICINASDRPDPLLVLLNSLMLQTSKSFDIVIVDDGNKPSLDASMIDSLKIRFDLLGIGFAFHKNNSRRGLAKSRNIGIDLMHTPIGVFLDDDHICDSRFVEFLLDSMERKPDAGCVGALFPHIEGRIKFINNKPPSVFGDILNDKDWGDRQRWYYRFTPGTDDIYSAIALGGIVAFRIDPRIRKEERLSYVSHTEDTLFSLRYIEEGYRNYVSIRALAYHRMIGDGGCRTFPDANAQRGNDSVVFNEHMKRLDPIIRSLSF